MRNLGPRYVYFIQAEVGGPIKIGAAQNVQKRLAEMQTGSPFRLRVLKAIDTGSDGYRVERQLHERFKHLRDHGEWFRVDDVLADLAGAPVAVPRSDLPEPTYVYGRVVEPPTTVIGLPALDQSVLDVLSDKRWMRSAEITPLVSEASRRFVVPALLRLAKHGFTQSRKTTVYEPSLRRFMEHRRNPPVVAA